MKVTKSAVYRLEVESSCGCMAVGEYTDTYCKDIRGQVEFVPCGTHAETPGVEIAATMLKECLVKEAEGFSAPKESPRTRPPFKHVEDVEGTEPEDTENGEDPLPPARPLRVSGVSHRPPSLPSSPSAPSLPSARTAAGQHRPTGEKTGAGGLSIRRATPGGGLSANATQALQRSGGKVAVARPASLDMDGVPEDPRISRLIEASGALDEEDSFEG